MFDLRQFIFLKNKNKFRLYLWGICFQNSLIRLEMHLQLNIQLKRRRTLNLFLVSLTSLLPHWIMSFKRRDNIRGYEFKCVRVTCKDKKRWFERLKNKRKRKEETRNNRHFNRPLWFNSFSTQRGYRSTKTQHSCHLFIRNARFEV